MQTFNLILYLLFEQFIIFVIYFSCIVFINLLIYGFKFWSNIIVKVTFSYESSVVDLVLSLKNITDTNKKQKQEEPRIFLKKSLFALSEDEENIFSVMSIFIE